MIFSFLERVLTSLLVSFLLAVVSFSYLTGKFPPQKQDLIRAVQLSKQMILETPELNEAGQKIQREQVGGRPPDLQQMAEFQRLALRRTEATVELMKIFTKFKTGQPNPEISARLQRISNHLNAAESEMAEMIAEIQQ